MTTPTNYIATWFYKESKEDASFYPQAGKRGDSALVHSIYMQIQVPFFTTFRHYHPNDKIAFSQQSGSVSRLSGAAIQGVTD